MARMDIRNNLLERGIIQAAICLARNLLILPCHAFHRIKIARTSPDGIADPPTLPKSPLACRGLPTIPSASRCTSLWAKRLEWPGIRLNASSQVWYARRSSEVNATSNLKPRLAST